MPKHLGKSLKETFSSIVTASTPGLQLRRPRFFANCSGDDLPATNRDTGDGTNMPTFSMIDDSNHLQPQQRPSALEKLLSYRRLRSQTQQGFDGGVAAAVNSDGILAGQDAGQNESANAAQPFLLSRLPKEVMEYVATLEQQNRQLRQQAVELYERLQERGGNEAAAGCSSCRRLSDGFFGDDLRVIADGAASSGLNETNKFLPIGSDITFTVEERERYINDILTQVDVIVQAHRNQSEATILKYKQEADSAKLALKHLREAVELEGVDLSMLPVVLATMTGGRAQAACGDGQLFGSCDGAQNTTTLATSAQTGFDAAVAGIEKIIKEKSAKLVDEAVDATLGDLLRVEADDDVPTVVRESVRRGFSALARHLATVFADYIGHCTEEVRYVHKEREVACRELREELSMSENQRLRIARQYEAEIRALRDELHAFHVAAADGDELKATVHERAIRECSALLVESRKEAERLRDKLEEERSSNAATCLRLKASLQRRNSTFEAAVVRRAEEYVRQRDERIAGLQQQIDAMRKEEAQRAGGRVSRAVQAQAEATVLNESSYMANLLSLPSPFKSTSPAANRRLASPLRSACKSAPPQAQPPVECGSDFSIQPEKSFEAEVWAKTMELITKYGTAS